MNMILPLLAVLMGAACTTADDRVTRQSFFQPQVSRGPPPKPSGPGFTGAPVSRFPSLGAPPPQAFRAAPIEEDEDSINHNAVTPSQAPLLLSRASPQPSPTPAYRRPVAQPVDTHRDFQQTIPVRAPQPQPVRRPGPPPPRNQFSQVVQEDLEQEELEEEKPDRLSLLLPQSKFDCASKKTGYYADDGLGCEVFHYCQDNAKHSWICPEGFIFHQVHLICMPPSGDNICKQSSNFHFVNEYLYLPINAQEAQAKPNVTLKYSDRYYPENYYEEGEPQPVRPRPVSPVSPAPTPVPQRGRPATPSFRQPIPNQVFHSPEEVNIPLTQRRPQAPTAQHRGFPQHGNDDDDFDYDDSPFRQG